MNETDRRLANIEQQLRQLRNPEPSFTDKIARLTALKEIAAQRLQTLVPVTMKGRPAPGTPLPERQQTRTYSDALRGIDFTSSELAQKWREYRKYLQDLGIDPHEVDTLTHSWEFASHRHDPPDPDKPSAYLQTGKTFLTHCSPWLGVLDLRPGTTSRKLHERAQELHRYSHQSEPRYKWIDYRRLFDENHG